MIADLICEAPPVVETGGVGNFLDDFAKRTFRNEQCNRALPELQVRQT